jgi:tetratricopeptide (TPR) repeat protein/cell division septation protein DedD
LILKSRQINRLRQLAIIFTPIFYDFILKLSYFTNVLLKWSYFVQQNSFLKRKNYIMKFFQRLTLTLILLLLTTLAWSQSSIKKANKQYELYAFNTAIKSYLKVLERQPNNADALGRLADCYRHLNRLEEAEKWYEKVVRQKGFDEIYLFQYGQTLKGLGKYDQARSQYLKFAHKYPVQGNQFGESCKFALAHIGDSPSFEIKNEYLNTASADFSPTFYKSNAVVYSSARRDIKNTRNNSAVLGNQPFLSRMDPNGYLESPVLLKSTFGGAAAESNISYSSDGKMVSFTKNNYVDGTRQIPSSGLELSLFFAEVTSNGNWKNEVPFPYNGSGYSTGFSSFSADGKSIYFASDRPDGFGGYDIYVSYRVGSSWSAPENLGPVVNTQGNEITPFDDGTYLFFASDWHMGFGGLDIFKASKKNTRWSVVEHGGNGLNSSRDDYGFVYNTNISKGYFVSNRVDSKGHEDVYSIGRSSFANGFVGNAGTVNPSTNSGFGGSTNSGNTTTSSGNTNTSNSPGNTSNNQGQFNGTRSLAFQIFDSASGSPITNATVDLSECGEGIQTTNSQGQVFLNRGRSYVCSAFISANKFNPKNINVRSYITNKTGNIPIYLNKADNVFRGQITDRLSGYLLGGALVEATSSKYPQRHRANSTSDGKYSLPLKTNTIYAMRFSKVGYRDNNITVSTGNSADKTLESVAMTSASAIANNNEGSTNSGNTNTNPGTVFNNGNTNSGNYSDNNNSGATYGFAVQVAAFALNKNIDLNGYNQKLSSYGQTYIANEKGRNKVRVGLFSTREEAASVQKQARTLGYVGAFIVTQEGGANVPALSTNSNANTSTTSTNTTTTNNSGYTPPPLGSGSQVIGLGNISGYVIQLGAFKNAISFNRDQVIDIGVVNSYQKRDLTVYVLTGYDTREQADSALRKAKARGFKTAFLVNK